MLLRVPTWRQVHRGCHCRHFLLEHEVLSGGVVAIGAARQGAVAGHDKARAARGRKKEALECHALQLQGRLGLVQSRPRKIAGGAMPTAVTFFGPAGHKMLSISCTCVCACVLCVCSSVLRVHVQLCVSPLQALGSSARSRGAAGLLSCGTGSNFATRRSTR